MTQAQIARSIGVNRSVINRELRGERDMTLGRVAEIAFALGRRAKLVLEPIEQGVGINISHQEFRPPAPPLNMPPTNGSGNSIDWTGS
jgi:transcriptional regulator with XRE-family HTH domain